MPNDPKRAAIFHNYLCFALPTVRDYETLILLNDFSIKNAI